MHNKKLKIVFSALTCLLFKTEASSNGVTEANISPVRICCHVTNIQLVA